MGNDLATYKVMEEFYKKGKLKAIGLSNFYNSDYENIIKNCEIMPAINQLETHIFYQNKNLREDFKRMGVYLESWAPFAEGKTNMFNNPNLIQIAKKYNKTVAQIILRFLIQSDIIVIPKSSNKHRMIENIDIFKFSLNIEDIQTIEAMDKNKSLFGWY